MGNVNVLARDCQPEASKDSSCRGWAQPSLPTAGKLLLLLGAAVEQFLCSGGAVHFRMPAYAVSESRTRCPGDEVQAVICIWDVFKKPWEVWGSLLCIKCETKVILQLSIFIS